MQKTLYIYIYIHTYIQILIKFIDSKTETKTENTRKTEYEYIFKWRLFSMGTCATEKAIHRER